MKKILFKALAIAAILTATTSCNTKSENNEPKLMTISEYVAQFNHLEYCNLPLSQRSLHVDIFKHVIGYSKFESKNHPELNEYSITIYVPEKNVYETRNISEAWYRFVEAIFEDHLNVYDTYFYDKDEEDGYFVYYTWGNRNHKDISSPYITSVALKY